MMYSGKMETFDGVITVTLISWTEFSMQVLKRTATDNLHERSDGRGAHDGYFVS